MANTKISNLTALGAAPATDDLLVLVDVSASETKKLTVANLIAAVENRANTFTTVQNYEPSETGIDGIIIDMPTSTIRNSLNCRYNGNPYMVHYCRSNINALQLLEFDNGNLNGSYIDIGRNNNSSTPAGGFARFRDKSNDFHHIWVDDSGLVRIATGAGTAPLNGTDGSGTVVGTQTSWHELKENIEEWNGAEALDAIRALTLYSYQMIEDSQETRGGEKPTYKGLVIQDADRESDAWFALGLGDQQVPVLNDRNLFGYMLAAIRHGGDIIVALQDRVAALEAQVGQ